jgi:hypothetical protein
LYRDNSADTDLILEFGRAAGIYTGANDVQHVHPAAPIDHPHHEAEYATGAEGARRLSAAAQKEHQGTTLWRSSG